MSSYYSNTGYAGNQQQQGGADSSGFYSSNATNYGQQQQQPRQAPPPQAFQHSSNNNTTQQWTAPQPQQQAKQSNTSQQQQQQQPAFWNPAAAASVMSSVATGGGLTNDAMIDLASTAGKSFLQSGSARMIPGLEGLFQNLRKYFAVDNKYVKRKMTKLLFPFLSKQWKRQVRTGIVCIITTCVQMYTVANHHVYSLLHYIYCSHRTLTIPIRRIWHFLPVTRMRPTCTCRA